MRRSSIRLLSATLVLCVLQGMTPAGAALIERDIGLDANDIPPNGHIDPDIRSKVRTKVPDGSRGGSELVIDYTPSDRGWYG